MSDYLPLEILFQIFLNLPPKSLRRFLSVSKSWYALITSKPFVSAHLTRTPHKENNTFFTLNLLSSFPKGNDEKFYFYLDHQTHNQFLETQNQFLDDKTQNGFVDVETQIKNLDVETQNRDLDVGTQNMNLDDETLIKNLDVETQNKNLDVGTQSEFLDVETQIKNLDVETQNRNLDVGTQNRDLDVETQKRDLDYRTQNKDLDVETQNRDLDDQTQNEFLDDETQNEETTDSLLGVISSVMYAPLVSKGWIINRVIGISNGLICFVKCVDHKIDLNLFLWNPAIDVFATFPSPGISGDFPDLCALGFWFDSRNNDIKLMRIVYRWNKEVVESYDLPPLAEVYSLNTGEWRRINVDGVRCYMPYSSWTHVYVNGRSHWIGCRYNPFRCLIMSFDMNDEVVGEIQLPSELALMNVSNVTITETSGCIAVIGDDLNVGFLSVWVMKEYGVFDSWTNLFKIPIDTGPNYYKFLGFWRNGDVLMMRNCLRLVLYSPESKSAIDLDVDGRFSTYAGRYEESLALLDSEFSDEWMDEIDATSLLNDKEFNV